MPSTPVSAAVAALVAAPALVLAASPPAAAQRLATVDETGDVWVVEEESIYSPYEGVRHNVDVTSSAVRHTATRVVATVRYDDLVRDRDDVAAVVRVRTDGPRTYRVKLSAGPGNRDGRVVLHRYTDDGLVPVERTGVRHTVDYADDRLVVSIPRRLLGRPDWVRYTGEATAQEEGSGTAYTDALLSADPVNDLFSRRIHRG